MSGFIHLVGPGSVMSWMPYFRAAGDDDPVVPLGPVDPVDPRRLEQLCAGRVAVFVSDHDTLLRDRALADRLETAGHRVLCQSHRAVLLGMDKLVMKEFLRAEGFPTLPWWHARERADGEGLDGAVVVKARHGTQSQGIRLLGPGGPPVTAREFCEPYRDGIEYSMIAYRDAERLVIFPPVWKGPTGRDLVPPWRRLRRCPLPEPDPVLSELLYELTAGIAVRAEITGYVEIEYLVPEDGGPLVLELNPRLSGTMRLAAMATGVPVFSPHTLQKGHGRPPAVRLAAEIPHDGPAWSDPEAGVFATSRLTVAADDPAALLAKLRLHSPDSRWLAAAAFAGQAA
ncbi:hypothetical protein Aph01nite_35910 [Acrocarpospora phusangensis]|uniref:ATP-grasp domain-containing protein n=1 Tax=Acrocarpospora phusangensis TaxID=1070424 RepID=A0A919QC40_9ACTN|nr:hypothetical protein [Acrocarpospora phusangensis]GIH25281.1 hypothetical protein Aph01nite_35910 [Acrocarpospora phusangensis]